MKPPRRRAHSAVNARSLFVALAINLALRQFAAPAGAADGGKPRDGSPVIGQPAPASSCDQLFSQSDTLAAYCQCSDLDEGAAAPDRSQVLAPTPAHSIGQLSCAFGHSLQQSAAELNGLSSGASAGGYLVDHLSVSGQVDLAEAAPPPPPRPAAASPLRAVHLSLQLSFVHAAAANASRAGESVLDIGPKIGEIVASLLADGERTVQSMSILLAEGLGDEVGDHHGQQASGEAHLAPACNNQTVISASGEPIAVHLDPSGLVQRLRSLDRLEISTAASQPGAGTGEEDGKTVTAVRFAAVVLGQSEADEPCQLKWLNLASNNGLEFAAPLGRCRQLEYVNVESNRLGRFPLYYLYAAAEFDSHELGDQSIGAIVAANGPRLFHGLPQLKSLNLANNKLQQLQRDLFAGQTNTSGTIEFVSICKWGPNEHKVFLLPSLNQLDLSRNRLSSLTPAEAELILCTMPNLSQLYLQNNLIVQVNLNALLYSKGRPAAPLFSRIEYIDLSRNHLVRVLADNGSLAAIDQQQIMQTGPRVRSINLGHNHLRASLTPVDCDSLRRLSTAVRSREDGDACHEADELTALESVIDIRDGSATSICDLVSPGRYHSNGTLDEDSLINELTYSHNSLAHVGAADFDSAKCRLVQVLRLDNNRIMQIEERSLSSLISLEELDLSDNYLSNLPGELFRANIKLKTLDLSGNRIKLLHSHIFDSLVHLEEIFLHRNELAHDLDHQLFKQNALLNTVDLSNNQLERIPNATFASLSNLRLLDLFGNHIREYINVNYFLRPSSSSNHTQVINLIHLKPSASHAASASRSKGKHKKKTNQKTSAKYRRHKRTALDSEDTSALLLSYNNLDTFISVQKSPASPSCQSADYAFIRDTEYVWLDHNRLSEISSIAFDCAQSLKHIHLEYNSIKTIDSKAFSALTNLEYIDLSHNRLSNLDAYLFRSSLKSSLRHLDLSWNYLMNIVWLVDTAMSVADKQNYAADLVETTVPLESLSLAHNRLLVVDTESLTILFSKLTLLRSIDLSGTGRIKPAKSVAQIPAQYHLDSLDLANIRPADDSFFEAMQNLTVNQLNLASSLSSGALLTQSKVRADFLAKKLQTPELTHLDLSSNNLTNEDIWSLWQHQSSGASLVSLNISSNYLDEWPLSAKKGKQQASMRKLETLNLSGNRLRYLIKGQLASYALRSLKVLNVSHNAIIELIESPALRIGRLHCIMPQMEVVDLSHNRLTWLPLKFFGQLKQLVLLDLSHNNLGPSLLAPVSFDMQARIRSLYIDFRRNPKLTGFNAHQAHRDQYNARDSAVVGPYKWRTSPIGHDDPLIYGDEYLLEEVETSAGTFNVRCWTLGEFLRLRISMATNSLKETSHQMYLQEIGSSSSLSDNFWDEYRSIKEEECSNIVRQVDSINADSTASVADRFSVSKLTMVSARKLHLSLANKSIRELDLSDTKLLDNVIYLNLGNNRLGQLPRPFCQHAGVLKSLDLNHNAIRDWPSALNESCNYLNYLNMSSNQLTALSQAAFSLRSLVVLDLSKNSISNIELAEKTFSSSSLKYLDLRFNKIKAHHVTADLANQFPLLLVYFDQGTTFSDESMQLAIRSERPMVKLDNSSLQLVWSADRKVNYTLSLPSSLRANDRPPTPSSHTSFGLVYREGLVHRIKFCIIATHQENSSARICIRSSQTDVAQPPDKINRDCFGLRLPADMPKCLTHLHETPEQMASGQNQTSSGEPGSSHLVGNRTLLAAPGETPAEEESDLVLNVINSIRHNWLKLRQLNVNEYLASMIDTKDDSTWFHLGERYPVRKMTVIKVMIVIGAISILVLLVMVFVLLVQFSKGKPDHSSPRSVSEMTDDTTTTKEDQLTSGSGQGANSHSSGGGSTSSGGSRSDMSKQRNGSLLTKSGSSNSTCVSQRSADLNTVIENNDLSDPHAQQHHHQQRQQAIYQHHLQHQQQNQAQPYCLTPSLSLAPSSVGTVETLQAIDSIQSGQSNGMQEGSYQSQSMNSGGQVASNYGYQQALPTATVMRIVKSSSTNFNPTAAQLSNEQAVYGTLDKRYTNYSALRARLNNMSGQQQQQQQQLHLGNNLPEQMQSDWQYSANMATSAVRFNQNYGTLNSNNGNKPLTPANDIDPTTLSLLSINTALSANNNASQMSPASTDVVDNPHPRQDPATNPNSLCEYHRLLRDTGSNAVSNGALAANSNGPEAEPMWMPPPPPPANIIFEQDEEQEQQNLYGNELLLHVSQLPHPK